MGEPIKVADFAENFIRLSGFIPHKEIKIKYTGLRPGEKLFEELFDKTEKSVPTSHSKLMIAVPEVPSLADLNQYLLELEHSVLNYSVDEVEAIIRKIVPNFRNGNGSPSSAVRKGYEHLKDTSDASHPFKESY
jgi:O-antigen biosynthesis protein WbqV